MLLDFIIPFLSILLAEFGDKTQLAVLSMTSKTKNYITLFFGVFFAFLVIDGLAIYFGNFIVNFFPQFWISIISGVIFLLFGLLGFFKKSEEDDCEEVKIKSKKSIFLSSFFLIFFAEMGDKSQLSAMVFATVYNPIAVFISIMLALSLLTIFAIVLGKLLLKKFDKDKIEMAANSFFIIAGLIILYGAFF